MMGVICCVVLAVMLQYYLRQSPTVRLREGLEQEFHITDVSVSKSPEGDGYTVAYSCDPGLAEKPRALKRNMRAVAEFVKSRMRVQRVRVIARTSETQSHKLVYPPETDRRGGVPIRRDDGSPPQADCLLPIVLTGVRPFPVGGHSPLFYFRFA